VSFALGTRKLEPNKLEEQEELEKLDEQLELNDEEDDELEPQIKNSMLVMSLEAPLEILPQYCVGRLGPISSLFDQSMSNSLAPAVTAPLAIILPSVSLRL
jgi:hypothetical protein